MCANGFIGFANFLSNIFVDPIGAIIHLFADMANQVLSILRTIANAIDSVFGTSLASGVQGWMDNVSSWADKTAKKLGNGKYEEKWEPLNLSSESLGLKRLNIKDTGMKGYNVGAGIDTKIGNIFSGFNANDLFSNTQNPMDYSKTLNNIAGNTGKTAGNTGKTAGNTGKTAGNTNAIKNSLDITEEDLKYLRDIAERETINRFTTAEIKVDMTNNNNIGNSMDIDGIIDQLGSKLEEKLEIVAEGVHD